MYAEKDNNSTLKISTDMNVVISGDEVTIMIDPLDYVEKNGILSLRISVIADAYQEGAELQSIELPKAYFIGKDDEKYGMSYLIRSKNFVISGISFKDSTHLKLQKMS